MKMRSLTVLLTLAALVAVVGLTLARQTAPASQEAKVMVTAKGFEPASLKLKADVPAKITFLRQTNETCATAVVMPDYKVKKDLPLNQPVVIEITPKKGTFEFVCGMNMLHGKVVVQ